MDSAEKLTESAVRLPHPPGLWDVLSGVRFWLATIVVAGHLGLMGPVSGFVNQLKLLSSFTAVLCFLTLSGYSIAHSVARETTHFYRRRLLRIYPLYLIGIVVTVVLSKWPGHPTPVSAGNVAANLFFLQTFFAAPLAGNSVVWTLAVEVACYAMAPMFNRLGTRLLLALTAISAMGFAAYPRSGWPYYVSLQHGGALLILFWAWMVGFLYYRHRRHPAAGILVFATFILLTTINPEFTELHQHVTIAVTLTLLTLGGSIPLHPRIAAALNYLGRLSYPLYLLHLPVILLEETSPHRQSQYVLFAVPLAMSAVALVIESAVHRPAAVVINALSDACRRVFVVGGQS